MERVLLMNWDGLKGLTSNLGIIDETFGISEDAVDTLCEIIGKLLPSDGYSWDVHVQLLELQFVQKHVWPILRYMDWDEEVFKHCIKLARHLTTPEIPSADEGATRNPQLQQSNKIIKQRFVQMDLSHFLFQNIFNLTRKKDDLDLPDDKDTCLSDILVLLHNLIWSEDGVQDGVSSRVAVCLLNNGLGELIKHVVHSSLMGQHFVDIVQLLHVLLKSDPGLKTSLIPSLWKKEGDIILEKNESCMGSLGSPGSSSCSDEQERHAILESPLTVENWVINMSRVVENASKASHLGKRRASDQAAGSSGVTGPKMTRLSRETETDKSQEESARETLKTFVIDFMKSNFSIVVETLLKSLKNNEKRLEFRDIEMYFILLDDFIPFSLLVSWEHVESAFCVDTFSLLLYDGVSLLEEIKLQEGEGRDSGKLHQRCFNCVVIWQKMVKCLCNFMESSENRPKTSPEIIEGLRQIEQIWQFFIFMIRSYNPDNRDKQPIEFLKSLIITNHRLLLLLGDKENMELRPIIEQFATIDIMDRYTLLLQDFTTNGNFLNNCLFTMMHHIAGDCDKLDVLIRPKTLNTLVQITDHELPLAEVFEDLIDYVFDRFIKLIEGSPSDCAALLSKDGTRSPTSSTGSNSDDDDSPAPWTELENTYLCLHYLESYKDPKLLEMIQRKLAEVNVTKSQKQIHHQLYYIGLLEDGEFRQYEAALVKVKEKVDFTEMGRHETIETCLRRIPEKDNIPVIKWLQKFLLEACYVKLGGRQLHKDQDQVFEEPIQHVFFLLQEMAPLIPFTKSQERILSNQYFTKLLEELGFLLRKDTGMIYPRIPLSLTPRDLYEKAVLLAGGDKSALPKMKFTEEDIEKGCDGVTQFGEDFFEVEEPKPSCSKAIASPDSTQVSERTQV